MSSNKISLIIPIIIGACIGINSAHAISVYENNISANNINMLNIESMSFAHRGEKLSSFIRGENMYGNMTRFDEYGDDGTTLENVDKHKYEESLAKDVWFAGRHINNSADYGTRIQERLRYSIAAVGFDTLDFDLDASTIGFGAYFGYINGNASAFDSNSQTVGFFSRYKYRGLTITGLINNGAIKNEIDNYEFNNAWLNVAVDANLKIKLHETIYLEPALYFSYDRVSVDDIKINGNSITSKNFVFWNLSPSIRLVQQLCDDLYGSLFAKYISVRDGENVIYLNDTPYNAIEFNKYIELGATFEYEYKDFIFDIDVKRQLGEYKGWAGGIGIKYMF